jgi:Recombination enhancement, RecA-dependent nuclease
MTKADLARFDALQRIGCICCRILGVYSQADMHHVLTGGRRTGHKDTIPLCPYHHRGVVAFPRGSFDPGPSLANGSKPFHARFGTQKELLAKVNELIK